MADVFSPIDELKRNGLCGDDVSGPTADVLATLTRPQVEAFVAVKRNIEVLQSADVQGQSVDNGNLALAMTRAMGWDRPAAQTIDAEVEGMSQPVQGSCACLCSGGGGGGGA
ncbi:hypothetical protein GCM10023322_59150 [Rugosimonospora acidiphila]|uniref:Uncharacterized protein n=1 Tax=Rugosimonospora acidiphila TaxID=556531 RepID=A0ABP9SGN4_9ACTN